MREPTVLFVTGRRRSADATANALESTGTSVIHADGPFDAVARLDDDDTVDCVAIEPPLRDASADWFVQHVRRTHGSMPVLLIGDGTVSPDLAARATAHVETGNVSGIADRIATIVADRRARQTVEHHRELTDRVLDVASALSSAADRDEIERSIYEQLSAVDRFRSIRVCSYVAETGSVRLEYPAIEGDAPKPMTDGAPIADSTLVERAVTTGTVAIHSPDASPVTDPSTTAEDDSLTGADGSCPTLAAPLVHADTVYGVVLLEATTTAAVDGAARDRLEDLGAMVGRELDRLDQQPSVDVDDQVRRFAEGLAHELRNTLGIASTHLELGREGDDEALDRAREALDDLERTVDGMLSLATGVRETTGRELREDVRDAWADLEPTDAELEMEDSAPIEADHDLLIRLLSNLLRNAVEHGSSEDDPTTDAGDAQRSTTGPRSADGGPTHDDPTARVRVGLLESGFYVEDDGPGIPAEEREHIFEWGYSASSGTGLGLGIVDAIADAHGWSVEVVDGQGTGARFEVTGVRRPSD